MPALSAPSTPPPPSRLLLAEADRIARERGYLRPLPAPPFPGPGWRDGAVPARRHGDILDLPEPVDTQHDARYHADAPAPEAGFDHATWSRDLESLLAKSRSETELPRIVTTPARLPVIVEGAAARRDRGGRQRGAWSGAAILALASLGAAGVVGGAAYGLADPQARAWLDGAGSMLGRLTSAASASKQ